MTSNKKPWLDRNGNPLSTEALKKKCKRWKAATWEAYLSDIEHCQSEQISECGTEHETLINEDLEEYKSCLERKEFPHTREMVQEALEGLTEEHREVLELIYYQKQSLAEVARRFGVNRSTICRKRDRAIDQLKESLIEYNFDFSAPKNFWSYLNHQKIALNSPKEKVS